MTRTKVPKRRWQNPNSATPVFQRGFAGIRAIGIFVEFVFKALFSQMKMEKIKFFKMSGSGNDFILFDNRKGILPLDFPNLVQRVCRRRFSIGADGVLVLEQSQTSDFKMRYFNADGGEAPVCGNGAMCMAKFAQLLGVSKREPVFESSAGLHRAKIRGDLVRVSLEEPSEIKLNLSLEIEGERVEPSFVNTGVPHLVLVWGDIAKAPVLSWGRKLRYHPLFSPQGTNVDFVQVLDENRLRMRTYERGVEGETLACGTGAAAAALIAAWKRLVEPPVEVETRGGNVLRVYFKISEKTAEDVWIEGKAKLTFEGEITLPTES